MLTAALLVFAVAAVGGLMLALNVLRDRLPPWLVSIAHGLLGATGLVVLWLAVLDGAGGSLAKVALAIFGAAALGGFFLASFHKRAALAPKAVVVVHALAALTGVGVLLVAVLG